MPKYKIFGMVVRKEIEKIRLPIGQHHRTVVVADSIPAHHVVQAGPGQPPGVLVHQIVAHCLSNPDFHCRTAGCAAEPAALWDAVLC